MQLDAIDMRILSALQHNGRLSNQDLADQVALSPSACLRRVRTLEEGGLIRGYHAELDAVALGFELEAIVQVSLDRSRDDWHGEFLLQMQAFEEVTAAHVVAGPCNYILHVRCRSLPAFSDFIVDKLNKVPGMRDICSFIVLKTVKDTRDRLPLAGG
ncbi:MULTISPECIES: Lrp/AsnC family transcriptional regulator [Aquitalea]|uniref:AsnC family transcriptional regulator n=2 Tax=Aquitalea TaxID=407217 RepID=A0A318J0E7_9NEIS|nr:MULTISPECIES: Lrp/AsnC family transcriptional regulator [Aquitalea]PXX40151.1 AsnC family transcriptional regulator [Aquitalea magnusonii]RMC96161.1 Lrp/AsnC family transcriptional regulator [Aquitalea palustris]